MNKFTKGPWRYDNYGTGITGVGKGGMVGTEEEFLIASIRGWGHLQYLGHGEAAAIQEANANLISAAPDMYEALKRGELLANVSILATPSGPKRNKLTEINLMRLQALAKAEGKE